MAGDECASLQPLLIGEQEKLLWREISYLAVAPLLFTTTIPIGRLARFECGSKFIGNGRY